MTKDLTLVAKLKDEMSSKLKVMGVNLSSVAKIAGTAGLLAFGKSMLTAASDMEQLNTSFKVLLGSAEKASIFTDQLKDMASRTPMETTDLAKASQTLLAFGMDVKDVLPSLQMIGDVSLGNSQKFASLSLAFAQVQSTGKLMGQDLLQMINQGFNPLQIISEQTGKSMAQLKEEMSKGAISAKDVSDAFKIATSEGGRFYNAMGEQSKTLQGVISTFKDNFNIMLADNGAGLAELAKKFVNAGIALLSFYDKNKDLINLIVKVVASFTAVYVIGTKLISAFGLLKTAINLVSTSLKLMMANPILLFISLAVAGIVLLSNRFGGLKNAMIVVGNTFAIMGNLLVLGFKGMANTIISFVNKALSIGNDVYKWFAKTMNKLGANMDENREALSLDFQFDEGKNMNNISNMLNQMEEMRISAVEKKEQQNADMSALYGEDLSSFTEANDAKGASNGKLGESFSKLKDTIKSVAEDSTKSLEEVSKKIAEIQQKILDLKTKKAEEDLGINQSYAEAYVAQEQKVSELSKQWANESDQAKKDSLYKEFLYNQELLNQKKTIELAYQNEVNEARRRASLSDFERQIEDLDRKRTIAELEFQAEYTKLENELKAEEEKQKVLADLNAWALKESDKILASQEKQTAESINRQIAYYNKLAEAVKNAKEGNYTSYASLAKGTSERASAQNTRPSLTINITGDVSGEEVVDKVSNSLMDKLRMNTQGALSF